MIAFFLTFIASSTLLSLLLSMLVGHLTIGISILSLVSALILSWNFYEKEQFQIPKLSRWLMAFIGGIGAFQFIYLYFESVTEDVWMMTLNPDNRGDLPFHIHMIRGFARGLHMWPQNPILAGERLRYPFGMDLFNAQFDILGTPLASHLAVVGLGCLLLTLFSLQRWMGIWGVLCFFLSGGFGSLSELLNGTSWTPQSNIEFKNLFLAVFVTQRGFLFALPAGVWLISQAQRWSEAPSMNWKQKAQWIFLFAVLPLFHLHTFFILVVYQGGLWLWQKEWKKITHIMVPTFLLASPFLLQAVMGPHLEKSIYLSWNWMAQEENPFVFWIRNLGTWLAILPALIWISWKSEHRNQAFWALGLFIVFSNLMMAPWAWDQIKILLWCYLFLNLAIYQTIVKPLSFGWKITLSILLFYPGVFQLWHSLPGVQPTSDRVALVKKSDILKAEVITQNLSPDEVILAAPIYDHPLFYTGQRVVLGYPGHIWSQGGDSKPIEELATKIMMGTEPLSQISERLHAQWILSSPFEQSKWPAATIFQKLTPSFAAEDWALYPAQ